MNNIKYFNKSNEELLDKFLPKKSITKLDVEKTGNVNAETMKHHDYSSTIRYALSNINNGVINNRDEVVGKVVTWINKITNDFKNINNSTMSNSYMDTF